MQSGPTEVFDTNWAGPSELRPRCFRTQQEKDIWMSICVEDEYQTPVFDRSDVVIDIGANIGAFAFRAWLNGSRNVHAYELNPYFVEAARINLEGCDGVHLYQGAVVRGDKHRKAFYTIDVGGWSNLHDDGDAYVENTWSLDELILRLGPIRFIKTDCEGSEWPIFYTAKALGGVSEIAGEYHDDVAGPELENLPPLHPGPLCAHLALFGFTCEYEPPSPRRLGLFHAWK